MMKNKENRWWQPELYAKNADKRKTRQCVIRTIRHFFDVQDFAEVDTPALQVCPGMEVHLKAFSTQMESLLGDSETRHLHTSPELSMKKLLVAGLPKIFQLCHCYRNEVVSPTHLPEFTMLEWYRKNTDYEAMMKDTEELVKACAKACNCTQMKYQNIVCNPFDKWERITVAQAFKRYADIDILVTLDENPAKEPTPFKLKKEAENKGIWCGQDDRWEDIFFRIMMEKIEPFLGHNTPTILCDYPTCLGALARRKPGDERVCERFEAYICGVELCNAFSELVDPIEQRNRFVADSKMKQHLYGYTYPIDEDFMAALESGMENASGNALGVDRLIMLISGADDIRDTCWIPVV